MIRKDERGGCSAPMVPIDAAFHCTGHTQIAPPVQDTTPMRAARLKPTAPGAAKYKKHASATKTH